MPTGSNCRKQLLTLQRWSRNPLLLNAPINRLLAMFGVINPPLLTFVSTAVISLAWIHVKAVMKLSF